MGIAGVIFVLIGVLMLLFSSSVGKYFSIIGMYIFKNGPFPEYAKFYENRHRAIRGIKFCGLIVLIQGIIFFLLSFYIK